MHQRARGILQLLRTLSQRNGITVYEFSNNGNHLHLLIRGKHRRGIQSFLRVFAGQVAQLVSGSVKGKAALASFWLVPVFSRLVEWGRAFQVAKRYVIQNQLEAAGLIRY